MKEKLNFDELQIHEGGRIIDPRYNLFFPWYTKPFLQLLCTWDITNWKVFEYGAGDSTIWWKKNSKKVISIDSNSNWAQKTNSHFSNNKYEFINLPKNFINDELFDCIIIDGEPVEWRDECIPVALECLKIGGILIIDNYKQHTVNLQNWPMADKLLIEKKFEVFQNPNHIDWKTGYWVK